jgi:hypothetical protein
VIFITHNPVRKKWTFGLTVLMAFFFLVSPGFTQSSGGHMTYDQMTQAVKALADSHKGLATIESFGKSSEGRDLWVLTIAKQGGVPAGERQGLLIAANFEGDHLVGSTLAVEAAKYLLDSYATDEAVKKSIDQYVYYVIPRMNPDGAEAFFGKLKTGKKTNSNPFDADNDGRMDEDNPDDLNGDGQITVFRVKDPNGLYRIDPDEPMLMKKADAAKGERGEYSIYPEGIDNDKDGFINEDLSGGTDINRNFMHAYPYFKENAGKYMVSENETRALLDWMLVHRNIAMVLTFGESDNLITAPSSRGTLSSDRPLDLVNFANATIAGAGRVGMVSAGGGRGFGRYGGMMFGDFPMGGTQSAASAETSGRSQRPAQTAATTVNTSDLEYFTKASEKYKEVTGIKTQPVLRNPEGAFFQYAYFQFGVPSFSTPGWGIILPADTARRGQRPGGAARMGGNETPAAAQGAMNFGGGQSRMQGMGGSQATGQQAGGGSEASQAAGIDATFLKYLNANNPQGFVKWQAAKHPEYGDVEVGGFAPNDIFNPPYDKLGELGVSHGKFAVYLTSLYAQVKVAKTEVVNEGGGLFRIKAEVSNEGFLPTALRQGVQSRSVKPTMVQLEVKPEQIIQGNSKTNFFQTLDGSGRRTKYEWLIKAKSGDKIELKVVSQKAGSATEMITLK